MYPFGIRIASMISSNICYKFYDSKGGLTLWRWSPVQQTFFHKWFLQAACQFEHGLQLTFLQGRLQNLEARVRNANGGPRRASDGASRRRCGRRCGDWRRHLDLGTNGRLPSNDERCGYGVNIHIDRLNEAIGDGDSVFTWKELAMGHWLYFPLVPADMERVWIQGLKLFLA